VLGTLYFLVSIPACFSPFGSKESLIEQIRVAQTQFAQDVTLRLLGCLDQAVFLAYIGLGLAAFSAVLFGVLLLHVKRLH
jgi:hypothetical protein